MVGVNVWVHVRVLVGVGVIVGVWVRVGVTVKVGVLHWTMAVTALEVTAAPPVEVMLAWFTMVT
jgi:hypothetical protein